MRFNKNSLLKQGFCILCCFCFAISGFGQDKDSIARQLREDLHQSTNDSLSTKLRLRLAARYKVLNLDSSRVIAQRALNKIEEAHYKDSIVFWKEKANILNQLGIYSAKQSYNESALSNYLEALHIREKIKDTFGISTSYHNLGVFFRHQKQYEKSIFNFEKSIRLKQQLNKPKSLASTYNMLGATYYLNKKIDSALHYHVLAKVTDTSALAQAKTNGDLATVYYANKEYDKAIKIYRENVQLFKRINNLNRTSLSHMNLAVLLTAIDEKDAALVHLDSAITLAKKVNNRRYLEKQYFSRANINERREDYKQAFLDYRIYKFYNDSIQDIDEAKRITEIELNYAFEKEKLAKDLKIENEASKKRLYFILLVVSLFLSLVVIWLLRRNAKHKLTISKHKLEQEKLEQLKQKLALATRENELRKVIVSNSLQQETLNHVRDDIKQIIDIKNDKERKSALRALSATLLSYKKGLGFSKELHSYLEEVSIDFKSKLDHDFPDLKEQEKELLCLMRLNLNTTEIGKLKSTTVAAIKSSRHRIRKKLGLTSDTDIIDYIENL